MNPSAALAAVSGDWATAASVVASQQGVASANEANRDMAQQQMSFQANMSNTAYQRQVADLIKAGMNPALAYGAGGASSPVGASANIMDEISPSIQTAFQSKRIKAEIDNMEATNDNLRKQNQNLGEQNENLKVDRDKTKSDIQVNAAVAAKARADAALSSATAANAAVTNRILRNDASKSDVEKALYDAVSPTVHSAASAAKDRLESVRDPDSGLGGAWHRLKARFSADTDRLFN